MMTCIICKFMLCDNRPIERVSLCVSADQAPEREKKVRISIAVNAPMHVHSPLAPGKKKDFIFISLKINFRLPLAPEKKGKIISFI